MVCKTVRRQQGHLSIAVFLSIWSRTEACEIQSCIHLVQRPSGASKHYHLVPCSNSVSKSQLIPIKMKDEESPLAQVLVVWSGHPGSGHFFYIIYGRWGTFHFPIIGYLRLNYPGIVILLGVHCTNLHTFHGTFHNISWILSNISKKSGVDYKISMQITVSVKEWVMSFNWKF